MTAEGRACTSVATIDTEIAEPANAAAHRAAVEPSAVSAPVLFATDGREPRRRRIASRRRALARDVVLAVAGALGAGWVLARAVDGDAPSLADMLWTRDDPSYPAVRVAVLVAVVLVAGPDLTRPARHAGAALVGLAAVASVVLGSAYPSQVLGGLGLGVGVGAAVRLTFGSPAGFPTIARVRSALTDLGVDVAGLRVAPKQGPGPSTTSWGIRSPPMSPPPACAQASPNSSGNAVNA